MKYMTNYWYYIIIISHVILALHATLLPYMESGSWVNLPNLSLRLSFSRIDGPLLGTGICQNSPEGWTTRSKSFASKKSIFEINENFPYRFFFLKSTNERYIQYACF